jgi:hypothetical protein
MGMGTSLGFNRMYPIDGKCERRFENFPGVDFHLVMFLHISEIKFQFRRCAKEENVRPIDQVAKKMWCVKLFQEMVGKGRTPVVGQAGRIEITEHLEAVKSMDQFVGKGRIPNHVELGGLGVKISQGIIVNLLIVFPFTVESVLLAYK